MKDHKQMRDELAPDWVSRSIRELQEWRRELEAGYEPPETTLKLGKLRGDELTLVRKIILRLAVGREEYGAWVASEERRDLLSEASEELADYLVYRAMASIVKK